MSTQELERMSMETRTERLNEAISSGDIVMCCNKCGTSGTSIECDWYNCEDKLVRFFCKSCHTQFERKDRNGMYAQSILKNSDPEEYTPRFPDDASAFDKTLPKRSV